MKTASLFACLLGLAVALPAAASPTLHVQLHGLSWHQHETYAVHAADTGEYLRAERFRGWNPGLGLRADLRSDLSVQGGAYRHSLASGAPDRVDGDVALYLLADYLPFKSRFGAFGASAGALKGYPPSRPNWRPVGSLTGRWQGSRLSLTLRATYGREGGAIVAADLGVRL